MIFMTRKWQKDTAGMKSGGCPKERQGTIHRCRQAFQTGCQEQVSDASWHITIFTLPTRWPAFCLTWTRAASAGTYRRLSRWSESACQFRKRCTRLTKRLRTPEEVERYFPGFMSFTDCTEQQIPRPESKEEEDALFGQEKKAYRKDTAHG